VFIAAVVLAMTACPNPPLDTGFPQNTIVFTLDGVEYTYSASFDLSTHAWGRGIVYGSLPPSEYFLTASASAADAEAGTNTIEIFIGSEGDFYLEAYVYDADGTEFDFNLGTASRTLLEHIVANLDEEGEQMQGAFIQRYSSWNVPDHSLENLVFSVERLEDYWPPQ
jgi:hypothetical protein